MAAHKALKHVALAAVFTAISIAIDVFFKYTLGFTNFGVPFYAIPLVFGSILLGPIYGVMMSVIGDAVGVFISGYGYLPLFVLAPIFWGLIPGLFMYKKGSNQGRLAIAICLTYVFASFGNTLAIYYYYGPISAMSTFYVRLGLIPFNTILMFFIIRELDRKLRPISDRFMDTALKTKES